MDRLTLPKRQPATEGSSSLKEMIQTAPPGVPPEPLPTWAALSYDSKLPMIPGPKGAVALFTTKLGERIYRNPSELDFDLTDPYSIMYSNGYKVLHDPHLKAHLNALPMQRRLLREGFITKNGKVLCTLKEFNQYRRYLRKIKLALERKAEQEKNSVSRGKKRRHQHRGSAEVARLREQKVREVRERLAKQQEEDRLRLERYLKMKQEEEERRQRLRREHSDRMSSKESELREKEKRRQFAIQRRQAEERRHKLAMLRQWVEEDAMRIERAEARRRAKEADRQKKLEESWEQRKRVQEDRLQEEIRRREIAREATKRRIQEREKHARVRWDRQQARLKKMTEQYRRERERLQSDYEEKFSMKIEEIHEASARRRRERRRPKRKGASKKTRPTSIWTIQKTILQSLSEDERGRAGYGDVEGRKASFLSMMVDRVRSGESVEQAVEKSIGELGLGDYKGAAFNGGLNGPADAHLSNERSSSALRACSSAEVTRRASDSVRFTEDVDVSIEKRLSGVELYELLCSHGMETESCEQQTDIEKAAKAIVELNVFLASKVIFPAYMRYLEEDHPDVYTQYFERPSTPVPSDDIEGEREELQNHETKAVNRDKSVRFSIVSEVIPPSELDEIANIARQMDFYDADDEGFDYLNVDDERDEENGSILSIRDSIEVLQHLGQDSDTGGLLDILGQVIEAFNDGKLGNQQVQRIADLAREILNAAASRSPSPIDSDGNLSLLAEQVVQEALDGVMKQLIAGEPGSDSSYSEFAEVIVNNAISLALDTMREGGADNHRPGGRPLSAPATPDTAERRATGAMDTKSTTSQLVWDILNKVAKEVRSEIIRTQPKPGRGWRRKKKLSETSLVVEETLDAVVRELTQVTSLPAGNVDWSQGKPLKRSSSSVTGQFVRDTLANVIDEMIEEGVLPAKQSSTSIFVESLIQETLMKSIQDVKNEQMKMEEMRKLAMVIIKSHQSFQEGGEKKNLNLPHCTRSQDVVSPSQRNTTACSATSFMIEALIRETLSKVRIAIQEGTVSDIELIRMAKYVKPPIPPKSATSVMAEDLVYKTLTDVTGFNIKSDPAAPQVNYAQQKPAVDVSSISLEAETAVRKALEEVLRKAKSETSKLPHYHSKGKGSKESCDFKSAMSLAAEAAVRTAIEQTLQSNPELIQHIGMDVKSVTSVAAEAAVQEALDNTVKSMLVEANTPVSMEKIRSVASLAAEAAVREALLYAQRSSSEKIQPEAVSDKTESEMMVSVAEDIVKSVIDSILQDMSLHSAGSKTQKASQSSVQSGTLVDTILDSMIELIKQDSQGKTAAIDEDLDALVGPDIFHPEDCDSSEDEFPIHPVLHNEEIPVDHREIEQALSILAVKKDEDFNHLNIDLEPTAPVARNSFRDLFHPDVAKVDRLSSNNMATTCQKISSMSSRCLFQQKSHIAPPDSRLTKSDFGPAGYGLVLPEESTEEETDEGELREIPIHTDKEFEEVIHYYSDEDEKPRKPAKPSTSSMKKRTQEMKKGLGKTASPYEAKLTKQRASNASVASKRSGSQKSVQKTSNSRQNSRAKVDSKSSFKGTPTISVTATRSDSKTKNTQPEEPVIIKTESLVQNVMDTVLDQMKSSNLSDEDIKIVEEKVKKSVESLMSGGKGSDIHVVSHDVHDEDEESSEDEFPIHPTLQDKELSVDHHLVENALSIISVRRDNDLKHLDIDLDPLAPIARNSFRDVFHPDISKVRRLSASSEEGSIQKIQSMSSKCMFQRKSHMAPPEPILSEDEEETDDALLPKTEEETTDGEEREVGFVPIHTDREFDEITHFYSDEEDQEKQGRGNPSKATNKQARPSRKDSKPKQPSRNSLRKEDSRTDKVKRVSSNSPSSSKRQLDHNRSTSGAKMTPRGSGNSSINTNRKPGTSSVPSIAKGNKQQDQRSASEGTAKISNESVSKVASTQKNSQSSLLTEVAKKLEKSSTQSATVPQQRTPETRTPRASPAVLSQKPSNKQDINQAKNSDGKGSSRNSRNVSRRASRTSQNYSQKGSRSQSNQQSRQSSKQPSRNQSQNASRNQSQNTSRSQSQNPSRNQSRAGSKNPSRAPSQPPSKPPSRAPSRQGAQSPAMRRSSQSFGRSSKTRMSGSPSPTPSNRVSNKSIPEPPKEETPVKQPEKERVAAESDDTEEIPEEIEAPHRRSWKRGSKASINRSNRGSRQSFGTNSREKISPKGSQASQVSGTPRQSRQTVNIAPRPSSGYRKSPTPASVASGQALSFRGSGEVNSPRPSMLHAHVRSDVVLAGTNAASGSPTKGPSPKQSTASVGGRISYNGKGSGSNQGPSISSLNGNNAPQGEKQDSPSVQHSSASLQ